MHPVLPVYEMSATGVVCRISGWSLTGRNSIEIASFGGDTEIP